MVGTRRFRKDRVLIKYIATLLMIPVLMVSAGYALFSQNLTINATTDIVSYVSNQYMTVTYTKTATLATGLYTYKLTPMVIKNNGVTGVTAWQVSFTVPADMSAMACPTATTASCSQAGTTVTIKNGTGNATIATGATRSITGFSFKSATAAYTPQNVIISGTFATTYTAITGLTVVAVAGTRSGSTFPLTVTISNNSGQPISGWKVTVPTTKTCTSTVVTGVTYTCTTTVLTYTGAAVAIAAGAQYQFNTTVTTTMTTWTTSGAAVTGKA